MNEFDPARAKYALLIGERSTEAVRVPFRDDAPGTWSPKVAECHTNVDTWVATHAGSRAVRGWVTLYSIYPGMRLTAHSVVEGVDGTPFDITPLEDETCRRGMRFVRHPGDDRSFNELRRTSIYLDCPNWVDA